MSKKKTFKVIGILVIISIAIFCITKIFAAGITHPNGTVKQSTQWGYYEVTEEGEIEYSETDYTGEKLGDYQSEGEALSAARNGIGYEELDSEGWIFCIEHGYPLPTKSKEDNIYQVSKDGGNLNSRFHDASAANNILGTQDQSSQLTYDEIGALEDSSATGQRIKYNDERMYDAYQNTGYEFWARRLDTSNATITTVSTDDGTIDWASGYILANSDPNSAEEENEAQLALWKVLNFNPEKDSAIAESELYRKAKAFEQYKNEKSEEGPKLSDDGQTEYKYKFVSQGNYLLAGPIIIEYAPLEIEYNGTKMEVMQIDDLIVYGVKENDELVEITDYEFTDAEGNALTETVETLDGKQFPATGTEFYIKVSYNSPIYTEIKGINSFEVSFYELDLRASAYKVEGVNVIYTEWAPNNVLYEKCILEHTYYEYNGTHTNAQWCDGKHYSTGYRDEWGYVYVECYKEKYPPHEETKTSHAKNQCSTITYCAYGHESCRVTQIGHGEVDESLSKSLLIKQMDETAIPAQKLWLLHQAEMFWREYRLVVLFGPEDTPEEEEEPPHKTYIDLGGNVWVDDVDSKEGSQDGLDGIKGTGTDYPRPNVKVTLYFEDGTMVTKADVAEYAQAKFENPMYTDNNGDYMFYQLPMDRKYYVEFVYDGMMYETTTYLAGGSEADYKANPNAETYKNNSKAQEEEQARRTFNDRFAEIRGNGPSSLTGDKTTGNSTSAVLTYKSKVFDKNFQSRLLTTDNEKDVENNHATGKSRPEYEMTVRTNDNLLYPIQEDGFTVWSVENTDELEYLKHINLGLKRRVTADLRLAVDIKAGATTIKDKEKVVFYKSNAKMDDLMVDATVQTNDYIKQEISASDYNWRKEYNNIYGQDVSTGFKIADDQLNVYVLYRIAVANQSDSTETTGIVTGIVDYFDSKLEMVPEADIAKVTELFRTNGFTVPQGATSWVAEDNAKVTWTTSGTVGNYTAIKTEGLNLDLGGSGNSKSIYLILKVKNNGDVLYTGLEDGKTGIENIAEITSYKLLDKNGQPAGLVDCDSAPYNATPGNNSTYEDDTDNAPMFQLVLNWEPRKISGNVWDDGLSGDAQQNNPGVKNVEVELIEYIYNEDDGSLVAVVRPGLKFTNNSVSVNKNDNVRTDENGNYEFFVEGGNYAVRFTYGDTVMLKDGASKKYNAQDFFAAQPYSALSSMTQYNQEHSKAFATEEDLVVYLQSEQKLEIDNLDASKDRAQSTWETEKWSLDTTNNLSNARDYSHIRAQLIENTLVLTNSNGALLNK